MSRKAVQVVLLKSGDDAHPPVREAFEAAHPNVTDVTWKWYRYAKRHHQYKVFHKGKVIWESQVFIPPQ